MCCAHRGGLHSTAVAVGSHSLTHSPSSYGELACRGYGPCDVAGVRGGARSQDMQYSGSKCAATTAHQVPPAQPPTNRSIIMEA